MGSSTISGGRGIRAGAVALVLAGALAACGGAAQQTTTTTVSTPAAAPASSTPAPTTSGGSMTSPLIPNPDPTDTGKPAPIRTIKGTVHEGVERGCIVLTTADGKETFQPLGVTLKDGDHVTLEGRVAKGIMTTCMQGTPFQVTRIVSRDE